jgi:hypothetical protein
MAEVGSRNLSAELTTIRTNCQQTEKTMAKGCLVIEVKSVTGTRATYPWAHRHQTPANCGNLLDGEAPLDGPLQVVKTRNLAAIDPRIVWPLREQTGAGHRPPRTSPTESGCAAAVCGRIVLQAGLVVRLLTGESVKALFHTLKARCTWRWDEASWHAGIGPMAGHSRRLQILSLQETVGRGRRNYLENGCLLLRYRGLWQTAEELPERHFAGRSR